MCVLISCEAGGDQVPSRLVSPRANSLTSTVSSLERDESRLLPTRQQKKKRTRKHKPGKLPPSLSFDGAAQYAAQRMAHNLDAPLVENPYSLELIDVTRSLHHRQLFSPMTRAWSNAEREKLIDGIYLPYRKKVTRAINAMLQQYTYVVHLSVRSFAPLSPKKKQRRADVGLLYDPSAMDEADLCADWYEEMYFEADMLKVAQLDRASVYGTEG